MTGKIIDTAKVVAVNIGAITITATNIQAGLSIASLVLAISYTAWKWARDIKKNEKD